MKIYDIHGNIIQSFPEQYDGMGSVSWEGTNEEGEKVASGAYLIRVSNGSEEVIKKIMVIR